VTIEPNENGVYPDEAAETIKYESKKNGRENPSFEIGQRLGITRPDFIGASSQPRRIAPERKRRSGMGIAD
jgi:hypothetical protein